MAQIMYPPAGLDVYPGQSMSENINKAGQAIVSTMLAIRQSKEEQSKRKLDLWLKTGELTGELAEPTPDIKKAFKQYYKMEPVGIFATGGKTLSGEKNKLESAKLLTDIQENMSKTSERAEMGDLNKREKIAGIQKAQAQAEALKSDELLKKSKGDQEAMNSSIKYANAKMGQPFTFLTDDQKKQWDQHFTQGLKVYYSTTPKTSEGTSTLSTVVGGDVKTSWLNRYRALTPEQKLSVIRDPDLDSELSQVGLTRKDLLGS